MYDTNEDREAQTFQCTQCDEYAVKWNPETKRWECVECKGVFTRR